MSIALQDLVGSHRRILRSLGEFVKSHHFMYPQLSFCKAR
jgi:hypothetical protein